MMAHHILILDDSELIVSMLSMVCAQLGYEVLAAHSIDEVPGAIATARPAAILCDLNIPGVADPVASVRELLPGVPIVLVSGIPQDELNAVAEQRGADAAISKDGGMPGIMTLLGPTLSILLA
jgi:CheY-like chemotaxis protein